MFGLNARSDDRMSIVLLAGSFRVRLPCRSQLGVVVISAQLTGETRRIAEA